MKALREQIQAKREEFQNEVQKVDFDEGKLQAINKQISALQEKMGEHRLKGMVEVRKILTPEQFTKFQELKDDRKDEWRDHFKKGHEYRKEGKPGK
jgi:Spy/CpxP family protein refolding chaperone